MRRLLWLVCVAAILTTTPAFAQGATVSYAQQVFAPGVSTATGTPIFVNTYTASAFVCNQAALVIPPGGVTNPTQVSFDDVANAGKACVASLVSTLLPALPNGTGYLSTMTQTDNLGQTSARSAASNPFGRQGAPGVLTNFRIALWLLPSSPMTAMERWGVHSASRFNLRRVWRRLSGSGLTTR